MAWQNSCIGMNSSQLPEGTESQLAARSSILIVEILNQLTAPYIRKESFFSFQSMINRKGNQESIPVSA